NDDDDGNNRNQLQSILGHMPHLLIFYIREDPSRVLNILSFQSENLSVFFLDLISANLIYNNDQCAQLSQLSFVINCKALGIAVENRTCVISLINALNNLQALTIVSLDDNWNSASVSD
ncbi:unnamed protein product, partial [Adineta ricciae]